LTTILELAAPIAFFVAYFASGKDIYLATKVLMGFMALLLVVDFVRTRRIPPMHAASAVLVFLFGAATLILHNQRFIQWKPTVFFWLLSIALLGSMWIGKQTLVQRLLGSALEGHVQVTDPTWRRLTLIWVVFYALLGGLNLVVAFNASEATWVNFKAFGLTIATFVFTAAQLAWLLRRSTTEPSAST
jgi:intracellular septation protein